jgi:membrane-associated phospholipid phosphatase
LIILSSIISLKWKISIHLAGLGGILGAIMALSFRFGLNPVLWIIGIILISGLVGTSRMLLGKHNLSQIIAGFFLGLAVFYPIVYFI